MIVHIIVMIAILHVGGVLPSPAADHSSIIKPHRVSSRTQMVSPAQFQRALLKSLRNQFSVPDMPLAVDILLPKRPVEVPKGAVKIQVPPDTMNGRMGRRAYRMGLSINGEFRRMVNVVAEMEARIPVVVPVRFIKVHETIDATDLMMVDYPLPTLTQDYLKEAKLVIGKKATRLLLPNKPIQHQFVAEPAVIQRGDRVIIEVRKGGLLVQTMGIAKEAGAPGKMITVENQQSKRDVMGRVVGAGLVKVIF